MLTTYFRSSSYNDSDKCQLSFFLQYVLGYQFPAHISAWKGNIVHKAMELLARRRIAEQNGESKFKEDNQVYQVSEVSPEFAIEEAIRIYIKKEPERKYKEEDLEDTRAWLNKCLTTYKQWSPLERKVVTAEGYFDIAFEEDWAKYEYSFKGENIQGQLAIKGTMDLLYEVDDNTYEYTDLKSGKRRDFNTGIVKDFDKFRDDIQLLMYYYALRHKYPDKHILMTLLYINHGGAYPIPFDDEDLVKLKNKIRAKFEQVKAIHKPTNIKGDFKCTFCPFKTEIFKNGVPYCDWFDIETQKMGVDKVTEKYLAQKLNYGTGGGRTHSK